MLKNFFIFLLVAVNIIFAYQLFRKPGSIPDYLENKAAYVELYRKNQDLVMENKQLSSEIKHLRGKKDFIERSVRKEMGYVLENEVIYFFPE